MASDGQPDTRDLDISTTLHLEDVQQGRTRPIGGGSFADIYKCRHKDGHDVAVKVLRRVALCSEKLEDEACEQTMMDVRFIIPFFLSSDAQLLSLTRASARKSSLGRK